jgi:hypothetical protein
MEERIMKQMTTNFFFIVFRFRLQPYICVATTCMKKKTLQQHKEVTLVYEEGISNIEVI